MSDAAGTIPDSAPGEAKLVDQIVDYAIIALDTHGTIRSWNAGAQKLKGYTANQALGQHFSIFYTADDRDTGLPHDLLNEARIHGSIEDTGWRVRRDTTRFWGNVVITALHDDTGRLTGYAKVTRDLTEQHRLEQTLRRTERGFRLLVEQVVDYAIIGLDDTGVIRTWNAGAQRLKGYTETEAVGQHFSIFYPDADRRDGLPQRLLERARLDGRVEHTGWRIRQDSTPFWGDVVITALHDDTGHLTGYAKVTRDLTEQHRLEQARTSLFATVSHDLRSPIMSIGAGASLIANAGADERVELARHILDDAARLEELVDGLFDYAKLSSGSGTALVGPRPVVRLVRDCLEVSKQRWVGRRIVVITDPTHDHDGPLVLADRAAMARVLDNVIGNAVRYSADGTPITVRFVARGERVLVQVTDRGRGIAAEDLPTIFDEFVRGRLATDDGGTGLGLAVVRHLMTQQGGGVGIDSVLGAGTTVTLELQAVTG